LPKDIQSNKIKLKVGDVIFFDRSNPNNPRPLGGDIGRVYSVSNNSFECISGNSGGKWKVAKYEPIAS